MRTIILAAVLLPSLACAAEWVRLGETPEARIMIDKKGTENLRGDATAWLKFVYRKEQPGQTITKGRPFDGSINQYFLQCSSTRKFQALQLFMFHKNEKVGMFTQQLNLGDLDEPKPGSAAALAVAKVCGAGAPAGAAPKR